MQSFAVPHNLAIYCTPKTRLINPLLGTFSCFSFNLIFIFDICKSSNWKFYYSVYLTSAVTWNQVPILIIFFVLSLLSHGKFWNFKTNFYRREIQRNEQKIVFFYNFGYHYPKICSKIDDDHTHLMIIFIIFVSVQLSNMEKNLCHRGLSLSLKS